MIKSLIDSDLHVIATTQTKNLWSPNLQVVGSTFDGYKRLPHYFDCVVFIDYDKDRKLVASVQKDRTGKLPKVIPWANDGEAASIMLEAFGTSFVTGKATPSAVVDTPHEGAATNAAAKSQLDEIVRLKKSLAIEKAEWLQLLEKYEVKTAKDLTSEQADQFIEELGALDPTREDPTD